MKNCKVNISISDEITSIYINKNYNGSNLCLYNNFFKNEGFIKNGIIINEESYLRKITCLLANASMFIGHDIKALYLLLDINDIKTKKFEITDIFLKNETFNKRSWMLDIEPNIKINSNSQFHTFDKDITSWKFDNKEYETLPNNIDINSKTLSISGNLYQINGVVFNSYLKLFQKINIQIIKFIPLINMLKLSHKKNKFIQYLTITNDSLALTLINKNRIYKIIQREELGLSHLYKQMEIKTGIKESQLEKYKEYYENLFCSSKEFEIMAIYDDKFLDITKIKQQDVDNIFSSYVKEVAMFIETSFEYFCKEKSIEIKDVELVTNSVFLKKIFNVFNIYSAVNFEIIHNVNQNQNNEHLYTYSYLLSEYLMNEEQTVNCFGNNLTCKKISEIKYKNVWGSK